MPVPPDRVLFRHPIVTVEGVPTQTRAGEAIYARLHMDDWVNIIPVTADGQLVLVRQHRFGIDRPTLEIPGGCIDPGEAPVHAGARELREETGFTGPLASLGWVWSNPAIQTNRTHLFLARPVALTHPMALDPGEDIAVELHPLAGLPAMLDDGTIAHSLAVTALERALRRGLLT